MNVLLAISLLLHGSQAATMSRSGCVPYSAAACEAAAEKLGFDKGGHGSSFQGNYNPKGCYAYKSGTYKGHVYFGTGGTDLQKKEYLQYWRNEHHMFRPQGDDCTTGCAPLSADACKAAADRIGFGKGGHDHDFQGNYNPKGCYAYKSGTYKNHVYFGTGGTEQQMKEDINESDKFRPQGDDCYKVGKDECVTVGGPKSPSKCVFPFTYGGKTYNECVPSGDGVTPWCATKKDADGEYIKGEYGRCNAGAICGSDNTSGKEVSSTDDTGTEQCPDGYDYTDGQNHGQGIQTKETETVDDCGEFCEMTDKCKSFMWSPSKAQCKVYEQEESDAPQQHEDFLLCKMKLGNVTTVEEWLQNANNREDTQRISGIIGGIGEIMDMFTQQSEDQRTEDLLKLIQTKQTRSASMKREAFKLGTNAREVGKDKDGKMLFREKKMSKKGVKKILNKVGGALSGMLTVVSPVFLIGEIIWGDGADQNHKEVMAKLDNVEKKIDSLETTIKAQTAHIDYIVKQEHLDDVISELERIGRYYRYFLKNDISGADILKEDYGIVSAEVIKLKKKIGGYFRAVQVKDYGKCTDLAKLRTKLNVILYKAHLGAYVGCSLKAKADQSFNPEKDCLLSDERDDILAIENIMVDFLSKCNRAHVVKWTTKFIEDQVTSGSATQKKDKIKDFLDSHYPNFYYAIVVQGNSGGFCASGSISSKKTWDNDIYMRSGGSAIAVAISAYKSTCQSSEISTGASKYGLGYNIPTDTCWRKKQIPKICENFKHYRTKHTVTMYALFLSGAAKTFKGLYPCQGRVECDGGRSCSGMGRYVRCQDIKQYTLFFAVNQWKCDVKSNGRPSTGDKDCVFQA